MLTLRIQQMTIDGHPYLCPECAAQAFTLDGTGFIDALPVRGNCWQSHTWEEPLITLGVLKEILHTSSGRQCATDEDTFEITVGGAVLAGILHPEITVDDVKQAGRLYWRRIIKPVLRRHRRAAGRAVTRPVKGAVAATQAAALTAAWDLRAGGHEPDPDRQPEPINPCGAGCDRGWFTIPTRIHPKAGSQGKIRVPCGVCATTGEAD
ncbi:hypothetical protein [Streptomyces spectabilis]|uniref:Uncharacterized protein n=1 Tax=Streptomyces spectabilis TaxID=68270 RepID=A0A5P2X7N8_STRST|nr:hypothetical protein [Streptomyces spectabilis]MBB5108322.1 hypothetical protein [Streptomyces spectabilis]MCI3901081.1 hypothetical protein [Streptomyces spectabilis]QEV58576.1 hypothetical protein CP982_07495 [Streptomyces spectabilis]GGV45860.1 hypothetical protein GCM10010245_71840 [Streptomyces spectabilis]